MNFEIKQKMVKSFLFGFKSNFLISVFISIWFFFRCISAYVYQIMIAHFVYVHILFLRHNNHNLHINMLSVTLYSISYNYPIVYIRPVLFLVLHYFYITVKTK